MVSRAPEKRPVNKKTGRDRRAGGRYAGPAEKEIDRDVPPRKGKTDTRRPAARGKSSTSATPAKPERPKTLVLGATVTVRDMSQMMNISPIDVIKELMNNGIMANINQLIDFDTAAIIAEGTGVQGR